jgi:hypothetical protein
MTGKVQTWVVVVGLMVAAAGFLLARRLNQRSRMPNLRLWQKELQKQVGMREARWIAARVQERYKQLLHTRPPFPNRTLQQHLAENILPGLALYQVLKDQNDDQQALLKETEKYLGMPFGMLMRVIRFFRWLPDSFAFFRRASVVRMRDFPKEGWDFTWLEDSDQALAFNATHCFYLDMLTQYGAPELTAAFCSTDDLLANAFPESIRFVRKGTLARGDPCCDYRYERA